MQHEGRVLVAVLADVVASSRSGMLLIDLQGAALPVAPDCVGQHEFQLWPVERAFAFLHVKVVARGLDRHCRARLQVVPDFVGADPLFGAGGQLDRPVRNPSSA